MPTLFPTPLRFLDFDLGEDADGLRSWSALASPPALHSPALLAEVHALLDDLRQQLGAAGALDEGHVWDFDLDTQAAPEDLGRTTVCLHLTGHAPLAERLSLWTAPE